MANKMQIRVLHGMYKDETVTNAVFTLFEDCVSAGYVVVNGDRWGKGKVRVKLSAGDFVVLTPGPAAAAADEMSFVADAVAEAETDEQIMERIGERFEILDEMTRATINGDIRAMIVQGPPGVGKSFGVTTQLERASLFDEIAGNPPKYEVIKGAMTAIGLYATLYRHSDPNHVLVFDDCDVLFYDDLSLNLLKAALDSGKRRRICWNSDSALLRREGVPDSFEFQGSVIFITNLDFAHIKSNKLQDHLAALQSRCHFIDLSINTRREKILRIEQVVRGGMLNEYGFTEPEQQELVQFVKTHADQLREISLRLMIKIADLKKIMPQTWMKTAKVTLMK
jgi:hypothetical protein